MQRTLSEALDYTRRDAVRDMRARRDRCREQLAQVEAIYRAANLLGAAGIALSTGFCCPWYATLELDNPKDLIRVRKALGCKLTCTGNKEPVANTRKRLWVSVSAEGYPGLTIRYKVKVKPGSRCRIVTRRCGSYRTVVCDS
jgi:hypothetical protein